MKRVKIASDSLLTNQTRVNPMISFHHVSFRNFAYVQNAQHRILQNAKRNTTVCVDNHLMLQKNPLMLIKRYVIVPSHFVLSEDLSN